MTGPEHYTAAERVFEDAKAAQPGSDQERFLLAAAQFHATLAVAAATAMAAYNQMDPLDRNAWDAVAGVHAEQAQAVSRG